MIDSETILKCPHCEKPCTSKSGLTLHLKRCTERPKQEIKAVEPDLSFDGDGVQESGISEEYQSLNRKLISAMTKRTFSMSEIQEIASILQLKVDELKSESFKLENGEILKIPPEKAKLARRQLSLMRHLSRPEVLNVSECEKCHTEKRVQVGSEPKEKGIAMVHFFCMSCQIWSTQQV